VTTTATRIGTILEIGHPEAMAWAATELTRLLDVVNQLGQEDWSLQTDCDEWDAKAMHRRRPAPHAGPVLIPRPQPPPTA
jgi:hypothetical protein